MARTARDVRSRSWLRRRWEAAVYPRVVDRVCGTHAIMDERRRWVPRATGRVLEVGIGSGLNVPLYDPQHVTAVTGLDPSAHLLARAATRARDTAIPIELRDGVAEALPFDAGAFDTVVFAYTLCSVDDPARALAEARRVLQPGGQLVFVEHGASTDPRMLRWQHRLTPAWKRIAGNCHLDRPVARDIEAAGFAIDELDARRDALTSPLSFAYSGLARAPRRPAAGS